MSALASGTLDRAAPAAPFAATPTFAVIDLETTGLKPPATVIELGWVGLDQYGHEITKLSAMFNPDNQVVTPENRSIHHIDPERLIQRPIFNENVIAPLSQFPFWVAHNAVFERQFIDHLVARAIDGAPITPPRWICTRKCAMKVWPDLPRHSNQVLRYALPIPDAGHPRFDPPHRALPDALVTAEILKILLTHASTDQLADWTAQPIIYERMPFGKHAGTAISALDQGCLGWLNRQTDLDEDMRATVNAEIKRRIEGRAYQ